LAEKQFSVPVPGGVIAGHSTGEGEPVLVLHGGPGLSDYTKLLADELAKSFNVYRYQQRGLAPSTTDGPFNVETHVADALAVMDGLGLDQAWIAGHSWGGHLALHLALRSGDRLTGIMCIDTLGAVGDGGAAGMSENLIRRLPPESKQRFDALVEPEGDQEPDDPLAGLRILWPSYFADPTTAPPMPAMRSSHRCNIETFESIMAHFDARTLADGLQRVVAPCWFVVGAASPIPVENSFRSASLMPHAEVVVLDDCGHFPWLDQPGAILEILQDALQH